MMVEVMRHVLGVPNVPSISGRGDLHVDASSLLTLAAPNNCLRLVTGFFSPPLKVANATKPPGVSAYEWEP